MRLENDRPAYKDFANVDLTNRTVLSLLMNDGLAPLQRAFDEQNSDIAMINLSLSSYGFILSTGLVVDSNFRRVIEAALRMARIKEKVVAFYSSPRVTIHKVFAICFKRSTVARIGGDLSKVSSELYRLGNEKNFSQFASYVNWLDLRMKKDHYLTEIVKKCKRSNMYNVATKAFVQINSIKKVVQL